jgi:hypothetical protein
MCRTAQESRATHATRIKKAATLGALRLEVPRRDYSFSFFFSSLAGAASFLPTGFVEDDFTVAVWS